jgi:hypothetical protein
MALSDLLSGRLGPAGRLPAKIDELAGPTGGVVMLPMHLALPGLRECDISDDSARRSMYGLLLSQGKRNDVVRFINATLLAQDWASIAGSLEPKLRVWCERRYALGPDPDQSAADPPGHGQAAGATHGGAIA